MSSVMRTKGF